MTASPRISTPKRAAARAGVTPKTIIEWASRYGLGNKVGGRWRIDLDRLETLIKGDADGR